MPAVGRTCQWLRSVLRHPAIAPIVTIGSILPLLPFPAATRHLLNRSRLLRARQGSILVNLSRGAVVDETARAEPDVSARFAAIVLDVFETEPLSPESPLRRLPRSILTGHGIAHTAENLGALLDRPGDRKRPRGSRGPGADDRVEREARPSVVLSSIELRPRPPRYALPFVTIGQPPTRSAVCNLARRGQGSGLRS